MNIERKNQPRGTMNPGFSPEQLQKLSTQPRFVKERKIPGGGVTRYLPIKIARQTADEIFGPGGWSEEVVSEEILNQTTYGKPTPNGDQREVLRVIARHTLKVTVTLPNGEKLIRTGVAIGAAEAPANGDLTQAYQAITIAKSVALGNALESFGPAFGRDLMAAKDIIDTTRNGNRSSAAPPAPPVPARAAEHKTSPSNPKPAERPPNGEHETDLAETCKLAAAKIVSALSTAHLETIKKDLQPTLPEIAAKNQTYHTYLLKLIANQEADLRFAADIERQIGAIRDPSAIDGLAQMHRPRLDILAERSPPLRRHIEQLVQSRKNQPTTPSAAA